MSLIPVIFVAASIIIVIIAVGFKINNPKFFGLLLAFVVNWSIFYYVQFIPIDSVISYGLLSLLVIMTIGIKEKQ